MLDQSEHLVRLVSKLERECGPQMMVALRDPLVTEINLNPDGTLWFEYVGRGKIHVGRLAPNVAQSILSTSASMLGATITRENPIVEGEFPLDGSRLVGGIPPIAIGPFFSIRKPASRVFTLDEYVESGALGAGRADRLRLAVDRRENLLVIGGTGSGKTTFANALLDAMAKQTPDDRIGVIQDTAELQIPNKNEYSLRTTDTVAISHLLRLSMRMQPDRIVVGEVRGGEAHGLLKAWNSGHPGGLCTIHADSAQRGLEKLVDYIFEATGMESRGDDRVCRQVSQIIGVVVFLEKTGGNPSRMVKQVATVDGYRDGEFLLTEEA
jgi:type IV secretion system protein TrbB